MHPARLPLIFLILLTLTAIACSSDGGSNVDAVTEADTVTALDTATDTPTALDTSPEPDTAADAPLGPPDPNFIFEDRNADFVVVDEPTSEEFATQYRTTDVLPDLDVQALLWAHDTLWAGTPSGLYYYDASNDRFLNWPLTATNPSVLDIATGGGVDLALAHPDGYSIIDLDAGTDGYHALSEGILCVAVDDTELWVGGNAGADTELWVGGNAGAGPVDQSGVWSPFATTKPVLDLVFVEGEFFPFGAGTGGLVTFTEMGSETSSLAETDMGTDYRCLARYRGGVVLGTQPGLVAFEHMEEICLHRPALGEDQLALGEVTALDTQNSLVLVGHATGASAYLPAETCGEPNVHVDHYNSLRWLPSDDVRAVALGPDGARWIGTAAGISRIDLIPWTLAEKAEHMEAYLDAHFWRMDGFVTSDAFMEDAWDPTRPITSHDKDNDGLWTQMQLGAWVFAYGATGESKYCDQARKAMNTMFLQVDIPAVDFEAAGLERGFVTRSLVRDDEGDVFAGKMDQGNWHFVTWTDGHSYYWKDDTSSDEIAGHFFGYPLYYDICAQSEEEKAAVADHAGAIAAYILNAGFRLIDLDGEQTTHGKWEPERIAIALDGVPACLAAGHNLEDCGSSFGGGGWLNATEILGTMLAAYHMTGDLKFYEAYETLVTDHRYGELVDFSRNILTVTDPAVMNHSDHELAMLAYFTLIRYEPDPVRRQRWIDSMLAVYEHIRPERNGLWGVLVASATHDRGDFDDTVRTLHEIPVDLRQFPMDKSHREDLRYVGLDRFGDPQIDRAVPYDENRTFWWNSNPYSISDGGNPKALASPMLWLLPYWGLKYFGVVE